MSKIKSVKESRRKDREVFQKMSIKDTLNNLLHKRFTKKTLEAHLTDKFGVYSNYRTKKQMLEDVSKDDDELGDWNLLGQIDRKKDGVHIYAYYDIYFLKMKSEGFDGADIYITEVAIEFE